MKKWQATNTNQAKVKYIGMMEFQDDKKEFHNFEIVHVQRKKPVRLYGRDKSYIQLRVMNRIQFGSCTNVGFMESGYMDVDDCFSLDENLQELLEELEVFYRDGKDYCNRIVCNERM